MTNVDYPWDAIERFFAARTEVNIAMRVYIESRGLIHVEYSLPPICWSTPMKHLNIRWNPATNEWFCIKCGRTSDHISVQDAHVELDQYECQVPSVESQGNAPGTKTTRLIRTPLKRD